MYAQKASTKNNDLQADVLIVGSGVAGLTLAIKLAEKRSDLNIVITSKSRFRDSNSTLAQGGVAAVMNRFEDSVHQHIKDTLIAGDGLCDQAVVTEVVLQGAARIIDLMRWGWKPDVKSRDALDLAKEGGHSAHRVVHDKDQTGKSIIEVLLNRASNLTNIKLLENWLSLDLMMHNKSCSGAVFYNHSDRRMCRIYAGRTVLATGGAGQVYAVTTNPDGATGDGLAMAKLIGAEIKFMEFVQFHPTALFQPNQRGNAFLISEAVRGHGAILKHKDGEPFMDRYDQRGSLAPRDIVARAISSEKIEKGVTHVYLDCRHLTDFEEKFPYITKICREASIDPLKEMIPVAPAAHYMCGGISTNLAAQSSIPHLYAIGECAYTGLHGANRLASNSLLEALVFAHNCARELSSLSSCEYRSNAMDDNSLEIPGKKNESAGLLNLRKRIRNLMSAKAGIVRNNSLLEKALSEVGVMKSNLQQIGLSDSNIRSWYTCRNLLLVAEMILKGSLERNENRGGFFKTDNLQKTVPK
jgi:L-aspartate oxidase